MVSSSGGTAPPSTSSDRRAPRSSSEDRPEGGYVFTCNLAQQADIEERRVFAAPEAHLQRVRRYVGPGTPLFLVNVETLTLLGPFVADGWPAANIVPKGAFSGNSTQVAVAGMMPPVIMVRLRKAIGSGPITAKQVDGFNALLAKGTPADELTQLAWWAEPEDVEAAAEAEEEAVESLRSTEILLVKEDQQEAMSPVPRKVKVAREAHSGAQQALPPAQPRPLALAPSQPKKATLTPSKPAHQDCIVIKAEESDSEAELAVMAKPEHRVPVPARENVHRAPVVVQEKKDWPAAANAVRDTGLADEWPAAADAVRDFEFVTLGCGLVLKRKRWASDSAEEDAPPAKVVARSSSTTTIGSAAAKDGKGTPALGDGAAGEEQPLEKETDADVPVPFQELQDEFQARGVFLRAVRKSDARFFEDARNSASAPEPDHIAFGRSMTLVRADVKQFLSADAGGNAGIVVSRSAVELGLAGHQFGQQLRTQVVSGCHRASNTLMGTKRPGQQQQDLNVGCVGYPNNEAIEHILRCQRSLSEDGGNATVPFNEFEVSYTPACIRAAFWCKDKCSSSNVDVRLKALAEKERMQRLIGAMVNQTVEIPLVEYVVGPTPHFVQHEMDLMDWRGILTASIAAALEPEGMLLTCGGVGALEGIQEPLSGNFGHTPHSWQSIYLTIDAALQSGLLSGSASDVLDSMGEAFRVVLARVCEVHASSIAAQQTPSVPDPRAERSAGCREDVEAMRASKWLRDAGRHLSRRGVAPLRFVHFGAEAANTKELFISGSVVDKMNGRYTRAMADKKRGGACYINDDGVILHFQHDTRRWELTEPSGPKAPAFQSPVMPSPRELPTVLVPSPDRKRPHQKICELSLGLFDDI